MIYQYGPYIHQVNEVNLDVSSEVIRDSRGNPFKKKVRHDIEGVLLATGATEALRKADLTTQMRLLENAYSKENQNATLWLDDDRDTVKAGTGDKSHHYLDGHYAITGPRIVSGPNWPADDNSGEYATKRRFSITIEAEFLADDHNPLIDFTETFTLIGNRGRDYVIRTPLVGLPVKQYTTEKTDVRATQSGQSSIYNGMPRAPSPLMPDSLISKSHTISRNWSQRDGIRVGTTSWSYQFWSESALYSTFMMTR